MPFVEYNLRIIADLIDNKLAHDPDRRRKILTLSYPDLIVSQAALHAIFGDRIQGIAVRPDGNKTINWHKANSLIDKVFDTKALFAALGYDMDAIDIVQGRGGELIHDMSEPIPEGHRCLGAYDLVFDIITNQCFNIAQAWFNMINCCRVGGYVFSITPAQIINQGFWNVNPCAYIDFFAANGFEMVSHQLVEGVYTLKREIPFTPVNRMRGVLDDAMNIVVARKREVVPPTCPIMTKFKLNPTAQFDQPR